jgi:predicted transcriptional regulator
MTLGLKELLEKVAFWPEEDREELAEAAAEIEARRTGHYAVTDAERAAVKNGLQQVRRGEFASDQEMQSFWKRFGVGLQA